MKLALLGVPTEVTTGIAEAAARLEVVYAAQRAGDDPRPARIEGRLGRSEHGFDVRVTGREPSSHVELVPALRALNHDLLHAAMTVARDHVYVHAGVVTVGNRAIVLPGLSRAGKSTLVLALVEQGAALASDELLVLDPGSAELLPFPRAVKLRDECVAYFPRLAGVAVGSGEGRFVRTEALPGGVATRSARAALVVLPAWDPAGDDRLLAITRGEALLGVVASALNLGAHGPAAMGHLARLLETAGTARLRWRDPARAAAAMLSALGEVGT